MEPEKLFHVRKKHCFILSVHAKDRDEARQKIQDGEGEHEYQWDGFAKITDIEEAHEGDEPP